MKKFTLILILLFCTQISKGQTLQRVAPEQVGIDSRHLMYADEIIEEAIVNKEIPGAVLAIVKDGKMAYLKAYGNKSVYPNEERMTPQTVFDMASCSKSLSTTICTMILVERGKIRLSDAVNIYIPEFQNWISKDGKEKKIIRVSDLLSHTSGLPSYAPTAQLEKQYGSPSTDGLMEYISTCKRHFKPQTDYCYSCLNFITLQNIIEKVSGKTLREFARENLFDVLGMDYTDYLPTSRDNKGYWVNTSKAHWADLVKGDWHNIIAPTEKQSNGQVLLGQVHDPLARVMNAGISGNAGLFSRADDIAVLCAALQNGGEWNGRRILSPQGVKAMRIVPRGEVAKFGRTLGWDNSSAYASNQGDLFGWNTFGHTGYTGTSVIMDPDNNTSVILLINAVHPADGKGVIRLRSLVANTIAASIYPIPRTYYPHYYKRFLQFMDEPEITSDDIVMVGNSLTEGGGDWGKRLGKDNVVNRGIVGDEIMGIYDRLHQILPGKPKKIFLLSGANDVSHDLSTDSIIFLFDKTITRIQKESPETKLYLQSLLPINESFGRYKKLTGKTYQIPEINSRLEALAKEKNIEFINLFPLFTEKGTNILRKELTYDGLHLKEEGYKIWTDAIKKKCN